MFGSYYCLPRSGRQRDLCDCLLDFVVLQEGHPLLAPRLDDTFGYRGYRLLTLLEFGLGKVVFAQHLHPDMNIRIKALHWIRV